MRRIDLKQPQVARLDTIRTTNRQLVLNHIRDRGPISRSQIAHATGLQRSTISSIVEHLKGSWLVEEVGRGTSSGGRPPALLRLRGASAVAIGVDIATKQTSVAACDLDGQILEREEFPTKKDSDATIRDIVTAVRAMRLRHEGSVEGVGIAVPGLVDHAAGTARYVPFFDWRDLDLGGRISAATGLPVVVDNDANAAALAELWLGRMVGTDVRDFIVVLVHDGLGTGLVFDGQVYRGPNGLAGEFGHVYVGTDAPIRCSCGKRHCWEAYSCERAAVARYEHLVPHERARRGIDLSELVERARRGDSAARGALEETAWYLGLGIANLSVGLAPQEIVVCGDIVGAWPLVGHKAEEARDRHFGLPARRAPLTTSSLGKHATLMGALALILSSMFSLPMP